MLKRLMGFLVGVGVIHSLAYVPPTYAASADVVMTQVQAGVTGGATKEFIVLYNRSSNDVDVTDWCLRNKSDVPFACFFSGHALRYFVLPAQSYATFASAAFADSMPDHDFHSYFRRPMLVAVV